MAAQKKRVYDLLWPPFLHPVEIERTMIRSNGYWTKKDGTVTGEGLFSHYRKMQSLLWPEDDHHRWSDLALKTIVENEVNVFMGASDSNKTYAISRYILCDWWCFPQKTLWLVSSTELRGAELRIWGVLKQLFNRARERCSWLEGRVLESLHAITTESISEDQSKARLLTKGLIFIPCKRGNQYVGMGAYAGVKPMRNGRLRHAGDEVSFMTRAFLDAYSNWYGKENFKGIMSGNPFDLEDPLCIAGEPVEGWDKWKDTGKTQTWRSKFYNAAVVCFDGRDSPNYDYTEDVPTKFPYLIGRKKMREVIKTHGEDSWQYFNQCVGKPRSVAAQRRVITRQLCDNFHAFDRAIWLDEKHTLIGACDAAYGGVGGDRCVTGHIEFGRDAENRLIIACHPPMIVPINILLPITAEDQIAIFCRKYCEERGIAPDNFFFDARASLAISYARIWSPNVQVVDFGGAASKRVVSADSFIWDGDTKTNRLQRCDEAYSKFVTELWWAIHQIVAADQMRQLPKEVAEELFKREWHYTRNNRIEVETKAEMKERTTYSPDLADWLVTAVEGAKRRGFIVAGLKDTNNEVKDNLWKQKLRQRQEELNRGGVLNYAV